MKNINRQAMKAYSVFIETPLNGALLVFAYTPGQAKAIGLCQHPAVGLDYIDFKCWRVPRMDPYSRYNFPHYIGRNDELPEGVEFYTNDDL